MHMVGAYACGCPVSPAALDATGPELFSLVRCKACATAADAKWRAMFSPYPLERYAQTFTIQPECAHKFGFLVPPRLEDTVRVTGFELKEEPYLGPGAGLDLWIESMRIGRESMLVYGAPLPPLALLMGPLDSFTIPCAMEFSLRLRNLGPYPITLTLTPVGVIFSDL